MTNSFNFFIFSAMLSSCHVDIYAAVWDVGIPLTSVHSAEPLLHKS